MREPGYYWVKVSPDDEWEPIYFNGTYWDNQRWMVDKLFAEFVLETFGDQVHVNSVENPETSQKIEASERP